MYSVFGYFYKWIFQIGSSFLTDSDPNSEKSPIRIWKKTGFKTLLFLPESGSGLAKNPDPIRKILIRIHEKNVQKLLTAKHRPYRQVPQKPF